MRELSIAGERSGVSPCHDTVAAADFSTARCFVASLRSRQRIPDIVPDAVRGLFACRRGLHLRDTGPILRVLDDSYFVPSVREIVVNGCVLSFQIRVREGA